MNVKRSIKPPTSKQTNKQTNKQASKQTNKQTNNMRAVFGLQAIVCAQHSTIHKQVHVHCSMRWVNTDA